MNCQNVFCLIYPFYDQGCSAVNALLTLLTFIIHQNPSLGFIFDLSPKFIADNFYSFITSHIVNNSYPSYLHDMPCANPNLVSFSY